MPSDDQFKPVPRPSLAHWSACIAERHPGTRWTVVEIKGHIKVKWDSGATSYFTHGHVANVQIDPLPPALQFQIEGPVTILQNGKSASQVIIPRVR